MESPKKAYGQGRMLKARAESIFLFFGGWEEHKKDPKGNISPGWTKIDARTSCLMNREFTLGTAGEVHGKETGNYNPRWSVSRKTRTKGESGARAGL